jgi:hypothetical protein
MFTCEWVKVWLPPVIGGIFTVVGLGVAVWGWYKAHAMSQRRDQDNKRREQRVQHLFSAFLAFVRYAGAVSREPNRSHEVEKEVQAGAAAIQTFGTQKLNELVAKFLESGAELDALLFALRHELRVELGLPAMTGSIKWTRIDPPPPPNGPASFQAS